MACPAHINIHRRTEFIASYAGRTKNACGCKTRYLKHILEATSGKKLMRKKKPRYPVTGTGACPLSSLRQASYGIST
jgi:hypothetical protein